MAFTPEDGTGLENSNSYITEAEFREYFGDRGIDVSDMNQIDVETSCVRATDYIDKRFGCCFLGESPLKSSQSLEWPKLDAIDGSGYLITGIPKKLKQACAEYALRAFNLGELAPDPALAFPTRNTTGEGSDSSAGLVQSKREKVGPIEEETQYADLNSSVFKTVSNGTAGALLPPYPAADMLISSLLEDSREIVRA